MEEIELTYLAKYLPQGLEQSRCVEMLDIYIPQAAVHPKLRIRRMGERYEITKKSLINEGDASRQLEETIHITQGEFQELSGLLGKRVAKKRYFFQERGTEYQVDVFKEDLKGLVLIDIEFDSFAKKTVFEAPEWCLVDVTQEEFIAGGMLCGKKYDDISGRLAQFNYKKID